MEITYRFDITPSTEEIIGLYDDAGLERPTADKGRIGHMYAHSNLILTAWEDSLLVGVSRSLTDWCFCCYLSDLCVRKSYQHKGIGKKMVLLTKEKIGDECTLLLLSAPTAMEYYPHIGMQKIENGFIIRRTS